MTHYFAKFHLRFQEISNNPNIIVKSKYLESPFDDSDLTFAATNITQKYGFNIPFEFKEYLDASSDTSLRFYYKKNGKIAGGGEFKLNVLYDTLISTADPMLWHDKMTTDEIDILKTFRVIDEHPDSGDFKLAAFRLEPGVCPPNFPDIYFFDRGSFFKMNINYGTYLDSLNDLLGVGNWQYLFCEINMRSNEYRWLYSELRETLDDFQSLFPGTDYSKYYDLLRSKWE